jgi:hypothetical protein
MDEVGFTFDKKLLVVVSGKGRSLQGLSIVRMLHWLFSLKGAGFEDIFQDNFLSGSVAYILCSGYVSEDFF